MIRNILYRIAYVISLVGGAVLCGFAPYLYTRSRLFDYYPLSIVMIVLGFLGIILDFIDMIVEIIKDSKKEK